MCGITGFVSKFDLPKDNLSKIINNMSLTLLHRGPDDSGFWVDEENQIGLGHTRLSILDLSSAGHQPMISSSNRYVITYNGEIYNHANLRKEIGESRKARKLNLSWEGHSDTETLLMCIEEWGFEQTISKLVGMFSICLFDKFSRTLYLARDRMGEKPLYYGYVDSSFVFSSELKSLKEFPNFNNDISRNALKKYFQLMYIPCPYSIYENIFKLEPGHFISISIDDVLSAETLKKKIKPYWDLKDYVIENNKTSKDYSSDEKYLIELEDHLEEAIKSQSIADVSLGAFLSGGIDSSLITSLMQKNSSDPVKTFTVGFEEAAFDESSFAKDIATHLGTDHSELFVSSKEAREVIPNLPHIYDEPFADSSQIPTYLVCAAASSKVKVALSGDAGDELFGGYNRYLWGPKLWNKVSWAPFQLRNFLGYSIDSIPSYGWNALEKSLNTLSGRNINKIGNKVSKLSKGMRVARNINDLYISLISEWNDPDDIVIDDFNSSNEFFSVLNTDGPYKNSSLNMMYKDSLTYLPDDILCKVDRAAMANSLETRVPFLDHRVVEFAMKMPLNMKIRDGRGKWALRQILYKYVPQSMLDRPKTGFSIPVGEWLRGPLKDWAEDLMDEEKLIKQGFLNHTTVRQAWILHLSGKNDYTSRIWSVLMFQSWLDLNS